MCDTDNQHDEDSFAHLVDHTAICDAEPTETPHFTFQRVAEEWILSQAVDRRGNPPLVRLDDLLEFLGRAALNPY